VTDQQRLVVFVLLVATSAMMWAMLFWPVIEDRLWHVTG